MVLDRRRTLSPLSPPPPSTLELDEVFVQTPSFLSPAPPELDEAFVQTPTLLSSPPPPPLLASPPEADRAARSPGVEVIEVINLVTPTALSPPLLPTPPPPVVSDAERIAQLEQRLKLTEQRLKVLEDAQLEN